MKVGDLTRDGLVLEVKDNPADKNSRWYPEPRKIALVLPYGGQYPRWGFVTQLERRNEKV